MLHIQQGDLDRGANHEVTEVEFEYLTPLGRSFGVDFDVELTKDPGVFAMTLSLTRRGHDDVIIHMDDLLPVQSVPEFLISSDLILDDNYGLARAIAVALVKLARVSVALTLERGDKPGTGEIIAYVSIKSSSGQVSFRTEGRILENSAKHHLTAKKK